MNPAMRSISILAAVLLCGCASLPQGGVKWHAYTAGRIKAFVISSSKSPPGKGWLVESARAQADGYFSYTKLGSGDFRYSKRAYFKTIEKWSPDANYLGLFQDRNGSTEFCVVNPEHGGYQEGNTFVITSPYDYCATLVRE
jgi:hypothetical protein